MKGSVFMVGLVGVLLGLLILIAPAIKHCRFKWNCQEYIKRAADSASPEKCGEQLDQAIKYAKDNDLTSGNTGIIWKTPACDVGFWYENLVKAREALKEVENTGPESKTSALERSNVLIRVRETLLDGSEVTLPPSIEFHPSVLLMLIAVWAGFIIGGLGVVITLASLGKD